MDDRPVTTDDRLVEDVKAARLFLDELKSAQYTGADSLTIKINESVNTYDYSFFLNNFSTTSITITFTADNQDYPFVELQVEVYRNSVTPANRVQDYDVLFIQELVTTTNEKQVQWLLTVQNNSGAGATHYVKARVASTDTGVLS